MEAMRGDLPRNSAPPVLVAISIAFASRSADHLTGLKAWKFIIPEIHFTQARSLAYNVACKLTGIRGVSP
jgi:hypothetical protein